MPMAPCSPSPPVSTPSTGFGLVGWRARLGMAEEKNSGKLMLEGFVRIIAPANAISDNEAVPLRRCASSADDAALAG